MKNLKNILVLLVLFLVCAVSCDVSDTALSELIRKSRPRDDIRWNEACIIPTTSTSDNGKVDAILLFSARGVHVFMQKNGEKEGDLKTPDVKNAASDAGLYVTAFIPTNYDTLTFPKVILQTVSAVPNEKGKFFLFDITTKDISELSLSTATIPEYDETYGIKTSSSLESKNLIYRTKNDDSYTYHIARLVVNENDHTFAFADRCEFKDNGIESEKTLSINRVWESPSLKNAVVMYNEDTDRDYDYTCKYASINLETGETDTLKALNTDGRNDRNLLFDHFVVYDDRVDNKPVWMGLLRSGVIYHSHSSREDLKTDDSGFSFNHYNPLSSFTLSPDDGNYGCTLFGRYSGTGFIVTRFLKSPNSNNRLVENYTEGSSEYRNSYTISNGFATDFRAEDVSVFAYFNGSDNVGSLHTIVALTVEVGISTYQFTNAVPYDFTTGSPRYYQDEVRLPFKNFETADSSLDNPSVTNG